MWRPDLTDQPGRWFAVLVAAPLLWWRGTLHADPWVRAFAVALFVWDAWWLCVAAPRRPHWDVDVPGRAEEDDHSGGSDADHEHSD